ncbi:MAG: DUF354 domain-containing protein [Paludibacteraceae bacterium]|nr:DUF354 domain-containing protein [Paludibacteraceae bacterium]
MNILIQLSHPAHFHLYKNVAKNMMADGHQVLFVIKSKDILETLLQNAGLPYVNINQHAHRGSKIGILWDMLVREWRMVRLCRKHKIDLLTGSTPEVAHVAWLLGLRVVNTTEDDEEVIGAVIKAIRPVIHCLLVPDSCEIKSIKKQTYQYPGYHELAYLHPNHFTADRQKVEKYGIDTHKPYILIRFAQLTAHHDSGIKGINTEVAQRLVDILSPYGRIYITSERPLEPQFEQYRIKINLLDMHDVMAYASLYIGDSQTMAAEAGVLGVPFVRFNDFVGRIGYLRELEDKYELGYGIKASAEGSIERLCQKVEELAAMPMEQRKKLFAARREKMLSEKIDCAKYLTWFIENYPQSQVETKQADAVFWGRFK